MVAFVSWVLGVELPSPVSLVLVIGFVGSVGSFVRVLLVRRVVLWVRHDSVMTQEITVTRPGRVGH